MKWLNFEEYTDDRHSDVECVHKCVHIARQLLFPENGKETPQDSCLSGNDEVALMNDLRLACSHLVRSDSFLSESAEMADDIQWKAFVKHMRVFCEKISDIEYWSMLNEKAPQHGMKSFSAQHNMMAEANRVVLRYRDMIDELKASE